MNCIGKRSGFYILVMYLDCVQSLVFDRKGTQHEFQPGWYVYIGSARMAGGLHARIARHQRRLTDGKRMHWNVDYFREHAELCEVWFCYSDDPQTEHDWAMAMNRMAGASAPVRKFGAHDCKVGCEAHCFHFDDRPSTAAFRSALAADEKGQDVFVEFVAEPLSWLGVAPSLVAEYQLGRQFLERWRRIVSETGGNADDWISLAKGRPARLLAEQIADSQSVTFDDVKKAIAFADAVEVIVTNCSAASHGTLFDRHYPQQRKAIMQLSRTSDVRQQYRIDGVVEGRFRSVGPQSSDTVFDTVDFNEVPSRLDRARGQLFIVEAFLARHVTSEFADAVTQLAARCRLAAETLRRFVGEQEVCLAGIPDTLRKASVLQLLRSRQVTGDEIGMARAALRLIAKNVWDFEEMVRRRILPSEKLREAALTEIDRIVAATQRIEALVERVDSRAA